MASSDATGIAEASTRTDVTMTCTNPTSVMAFTVSGVVGANSSDHDPAAIRRSRASERSERARIVIPALMRRSCRTTSSVRSLCGMATTASRAECAWAADSTLSCAASPKIAVIPRARRPLTMSGSVSMAT